MDDAQNFELVDTARRPWRVQLSDARATFTPAEGPAASVPRDKLGDAFKIFHTLTGKAALLIAVDEARAVFHLDPPTVNTLGRWMGRDVMMRMAVRAFATIALVCGALWIFGSFPMDADPELGLDGVPFRPLSLGLGVLGIIAGAIGRWRPNRYVLVLDAAWCIGVGVHGMWDVVYREYSPIWLVFAAALAAQALGQIRMFFALGSLPVDGA